MTTISEYFLLGKEIRELEDKRKALRTKIMINLRDQDKTHLIDEESNIAVELVERTRKSFDEEALTHVLSEEDFEKVTKITKFEVLTVNQL